MCKHCNLAIVVALLFSGIAAGVNFVRSDGRKLDWIRSPMPPPTPDSSTTGAGTGGVVPSPENVGVPENQSTSSPSQAPAPAAPRVSIVGIDAVLKHLQTGDAAIVDARGAKDYEEGHLRYALHIPSEDVYNQMEKLIQSASPDQKVIVYCGGGECEASHKVAEVMVEYGFVDIMIYEKGWEEVMKESSRFAGLTETGGQQ